MSYTPQVRLTSGESEVTWPPHDSLSLSAAWQEAWLSSGSLQTAFQTNHSTKLGPGEGSKAKRRALMLHSDPSILGTF